MKFLCAAIAFLLGCSCSLALATPSLSRPMTCAACAPRVCRNGACSVNRPIQDNQGREVYRARHPATWPVRATIERGWYRGPFRR